MNETTVQDLLETNKHAIAFYNLENLFDIHNDPLTNDDDFLPTSDKKWTTRRYKNKLRKLAYVISNIGASETQRHPAIIGVAEIENAAVLDDLLASKHLMEKNYQYVHYDSPDERGIDVALLYDAAVFNVGHSEVFSLDLTNDLGLPDYTRDILLVSGVLSGNKIHIIVNHWSSRREGEKETEHKRMTASEKVSAIITSIKAKDAHANVIVMGDFNDDPTSVSIKQLVLKNNLFNTVESLHSSKARGTSSHYFKWNLFDQILISRNFFEQKPDTLRYVGANLFDEEFLKIFNGKYKGNPFRTYVGHKYKGGYSDHFPVYITLEK